MLIDVHSHLDHPLIYGRVDEIIHNAKNAGVAHIITNGIDPATNRITLALAQKYEMVKAGLGVYPRTILRKEIAEGYTNITPEFDIDAEIAFIKKNNDTIIAISEVGLDFVDGDDKSQRDDFQKMIALAHELNKPIVVHSRKAEAACIEMLEASALKKIVMHCFCGKKSLVKRIRDNGWYCSIPTAVVRAQQFGMIIAELPLSQLFCETDSPFLGPYKERYNEPAFIIESYKKIAEIKQMELTEVIRNIYLNWQRVFE